MKRIFGLLCLAAFVFGACDEVNNENNNEDNGTPTFSLYDLVGVWACTDHISEDGQHAPNVAACTSLLVSIKDLTHYAPYYGSDDHRFTYEKMELNGDKLVLNKGEEEEMNIQIKELDGKHLSWIQYPFGETTIQETYINVTRILPGKWKIDYRDGYTISTFDANGSLLEEYPNAEPPFTLQCEWLLYIDGGKVVLKIWEINNTEDPWQTDFILHTVTDNRMEAKQVQTNINIVFERQ